MFFMHEANCFCTYLFHSVKNRLCLWTQKFIQQIGTIFGSNPCLWYLSFWILNINQLGYCEWYINILVPYQEPINKQVLVIIIPAVPGADDIRLLISSSFSLNHSSIIFCINSRCDTAFLTQGNVDLDNSQLFLLNNCGILGQSSGNGWTLSTTQRIC